MFPKKSFGAQQIIDLILLQVKSGDISRSDALDLRNNLSRLLIDLNEFLADEK